jgi:hypothetical protein
MDAELREYLQAMDARTDAKLDAKLDALEVRMREHTESIETKLLSEFWKWVV